MLRSPFVAVDAFIVRHILKNGVHSYTPVMAVAGATSPRTGDVPDVDDYTNDGEVYRMLEKIRGECRDAVEKLGLDVSYHGLYKEAYSGIMGCGRKNCFYIVPGDTPLGQDDRHYIESTTSVRLNVESAISDAGRMERFMMGRRGSEIWTQLQDKWRGYLKRMDRYLEVRTFQSKHEARTVLDEIRSTLLKITRKFDSGEAEVLSRDISSFFRARDRNGEEQWLAGPDKDPTSTAEALRGFIESSVDMDTYMHNDIIEQWKEVREQLRKLMEYYHLEAEQRQELVVDHLSNAIMSLVT